MAGKGHILSHPSLFFLRYTLLSTGRTLAEHWNSQDVQMSETHRQQHTKHEIKRRLISTSTIAFEAYLARFRWKGEMLSLCCVFAFFRQLRDPCWKTSGIQRTLESRQLPLTSLAQNLIAMKYYEMLWNMWNVVICCDHLVIHHVTICDLRW